MRSASLPKVLLADAVPATLPDSEDELRELDPPRNVGASAGDAYAMAAVGDSITAGFNAYRPLINRDYSWATGWRANGLVDSIYRKLGRVFGSVDANNVSISGSKGEDIASQIENLEGLRLDYVSVLIGANDVCQWPADHGAMLKRFKEDVASGLARLMADHPGIRIDLGGIPNIVHLYHLGKGSSACVRKWDTTGFCSLLSSDTTSSEVDAFGARWRDANAALKEVAQEFPDQVRLITGLSEPVFTANDVSPYDCFHPNTVGQSMIANIVWKGGWLQQLGANKEVSSPP